MATRKFPATVMAGVLTWPLLCLAQTLQSDEREQLQFQFLRNCSDEQSALVLRFRNGVVSKEIARGRNVSTRVSSGRDRIVFVLGRGECRIAGMISRIKDDLADDIAEAVALSAREDWPEMTDNVALFPPAPACQHLRLEFSLRFDFAERIITSYVPDVESGEDLCPAAFSFGPLEP